MIIGKEEYTWTCGKGTEKTAERYIVQCDNSDCDETFYRQKARMRNKEKHRQYCNVKCRSTHYGICKVDGCEERYTYTSSFKHGFCRNHWYQEYRLRNRHKLLELMGGACVCCGERDPMFLQVDHVFNDGHKDRKNMKHNLKINDYLKIWNETPERIQLLCANCNHAKAKNDGVLYRPEKFTRRKLRS